MREFRSDKIPRPTFPEAFIPLLHRRPLDIEIGAGQGLHAVQYCLRHPERTLLALERTQNKFSALHSRKLNHPQLTNLLAVRADAIPVIHSLIADRSVENVFLLYPNPHPKHKQANQRWHRHPFIQCLHNKLIPGGALNLATNLQWYAEEAKDWLCRDGLFKLRKTEVLSRDFHPRTHFERKYLERGETCFDLVFERLLQ